MKNWLIILILSFMFFPGLKAQDPSFSQFYANPLYLNPALAGIDDCGRVMANYRNQWPSIDKGFTTYSVAADIYSNFMHGGLGLIVYNDNASGIISTLQASGIYSYHLNLSSNMQLNAGFELSYHQQKLYWEQLIFADMIDRTTGEVIPSNTLEEAPGNTNIGVADFSGGLVLGIRKKYFFGFATHHLTQPDLAYYSNNDKSSLSRKYTFHAGAEFELKQGDYKTGRGALYMLPGILYQQQLEARQLNLGLNFNYFPVSLGAWYRYNIENSDGLIFQFGIKYDRYRFGYSYDYTLSKLTNGSGGAHEVSLAVLIACNKKRNRTGAIKCPEF